MATPVAKPATLGGRRTGRPLEGFVAKVLIMLIFGGAKLSMGASTSSSFDGGGHVQWRSTAIKGGECRLSFTCGESVLRVRMTEESANKLMRSIDNQITLAKTSNPQAWVEQKWKDLRRTEAASYDHLQEHQRPPEQ